MYTKTTLSCIYLTLRKISDTTFDIKNTEESKMKEFAKKYIDWYQGLDKVVKILLCILWDVPANLYRLAKSAQKDSVLGIVLAILLMIFGGWVLFVIDIVSLVVKDKIYWIDDLADSSTNCSSDCSCCSSSDSCDKKDDAKDGTVE